MQCKVYRPQKQGYKISLFSCIFCYQSWAQTRLASPTDLLYISLTYPVLATAPHFFTVTRKVQTFCAQHKNIHETFFKIFKFTTLEHFRF